MTNLDKSKAIKMKVKKGDNIIVLSGKDKGKTGIISKVLPKDNKVIVEGINTVKKHQKPSMMSAGGIIEKPMPLHASNVSLIDPSSGKATRIAFKIDAEGNKYRFAKKSGERIDS